MANSIYTRRCEGKRRMWRGNKLGTFKCGRKARFTFTTRVGYTVTRFVCGGNDGCVGSITSGYPVYDWRELA